MCDSASVFHLRVFACIRFIWHGSVFLRQRGNAPANIPDIFPAGDGAAASLLAARRLRASGFPPALREIPLRGEVVQRTAAALLFPLAPREWTNLRATVLRPAEVSPA